MHYPRKTYKMVGMNQSTFFPHCLIFDPMLEIPSANDLLLQPGMFGFFALHAWKASWSIVSLVSLCVTTASTAQSALQECRYFGKVVKMKRLLYIAFLGHPCHLHSIVYVLLSADTTVQSELTEVCIFSPLIMDSVEDEQSLNRKKKLIPGNTI